MTVPICWKNLGSPTEPGDFVYRNCTIEVRPQDIAAVAGDDEAIVRVAVRVSAVGPPVFRIASVEHADSWDVPD